MLLTSEEKDLIAYIDRLLPGDGCLQLDFNDDKQYAFARLMAEKSWDPARYPGIFQELENRRAHHLKQNFQAASEVSDPSGWHDFFTIPGLALQQPSNQVGSDGLATVVGGYAVMNLSLIVQNNVSKDIVASGWNSDFAGELLTVKTDSNSQGSSDMNVTAYMTYSYTPKSTAEEAMENPGVSAVVKRVAGSGATADPTISAPVPTATHPFDPGAINIGLGRPWQDSQLGVHLDYIWPEPGTNHPTGKIPFVGQVTFGQAIRTPLTPGSRLLLYIYVADMTGGGAHKLMAQQLNKVYDKFSIDPNDPKTLKWHLPAGVSRSDPGNPITFGSVTWASDIKAFFYCGIRVMLEDGSIGAAAVQSRIEADDDPLDGILQIDPIAFIWHCLGEGTPVTLANGSTKPIEDIVTGDVVVSNARGGTATVAWTNKGAHKGAVLRLQTDQGQALTISHNHVLMTSTGPATAESVAVGDRLRIADGEAEVTSVQTLPDEEGMMYNLGLEGDEAVLTFVAGGLHVGDMNAQRMVRALQRTDRDWLKARVPAHFHPDVEALLEDRGA